MTNLTEKSYWDSIYNNRESFVVETEGFRNLFTKLVLGKLTSVGLENKRVLEIGAGDSFWLTYLAKRFPSSRFFGLDYSAQGCAMLAERARRDQTKIEVIHEDMFAEHSEWFGKFDVVYSFGVVEHFEDLSESLGAIRRYLKPDGALATFIPNLSGFLGTLSKHWNPELYHKHIPHDWPSFEAGHRKANLKIEDGGYLGSTNFGTISSSMTKRSGLSWQTFLFLTRISRVVWLFESSICSLPTTKTFSPYIYAVSRPDQ